MGSDGVGPRLVEMGHSEPSDKRALCWFVWWAGDKCGAKGLQLCACFSFKACHTVAGVTIMARLRFSLTELCQMGHVCLCRITPFFSLFFFLFLNSQVIGCSRDIC